MVTNSGFFHDTVKYIFINSPHLQDQTLSKHSFYPAGTTGNLPDIEVEYKHASYADIKNECSYGTTPTIHLHMAGICYVQGPACLHFTLC
jgi:hypothetical protein